jgi:pimeloyl-ACP methyl ester carboxylesterase
MQTKLSFTNSQGVELVGILSDPNKTKDVVMILCHGFSSSKGSTTHITLEKLFNEKNIATFRFDFFGHGESKGNFEDITVSEGMDDVLNAIKLLKKQGYKKIGVFGSSYGGMAAFLAAARTKDLFVLCLKCPVSDYFGKLMAQLCYEEVEQWKQNGWTTYTSSSTGKKHKLNYSFFKDPLNDKGYDAAKKITVPTLIIHGDADVTVPLEQSRKLASFIKNAKLIIFPGCGHNFEGKDFDKSNKEFVQFVVDNV